MTQIAMREGFNARLAEVGLPAVSASSFNRYVHRVRDRQVGEPPLPVLPEGAVATAMGGELEALRAALVQALDAVNNLAATAAR